MKYKIGETFVEVEAYEKGMEDGFEKVHIEKAGFTELISLWNETNPIETDDEFIDLPYIGGKKLKRFIGPSDYIVTKENEEKYTCSQETLENDYVKAEEAYEKVEE